VTSGVRSIKFFIAGVVTLDTARKELLSILIVKRSNATAARRCRVACGNVRAASVCGCASVVHQLM